MLKDRHGEPDEENEENEENEVVHLTARVADGLGQPVAGTPPFLASGCRESRRQSER